MGATGVGSIRPPVRTAVASRARPVARMPSRSRLRLARTSCSSSMSSGPGESPASSRRISRTRWYVRSASLRRCDAYSAIISSHHRRSTRGVAFTSSSSTTTAPAGSRQRSSASARRSLSRCRHSSRATRRPGTSGCSRSRNGAPRHEPETPAASSAAVVGSPPARSPVTPARVASSSSQSIATTRPSPYASPSLLMSAGWWRRSSTTRLWMTLRQLAGRSPCQSESATASTRTWSPPASARRVTTTRAWGERRTSTPSTRTRVGPSTSTRQVAPAWPPPTIGHPLRSVLQRTLPVIGPRPNHHGLGP